MLHIEIHGTTPDQATELRAQISSLFKDVSTKKDITTGVANSNVRDLEGSPVLFLRLFTNKVTSPDHHTLIRKLKSLGIDIHVIAMHEFIPFVPSTRV